MTGTVVYVYAVARGLPGAAVAGLCGVGDTAVRVVDAGGLRVVVSDVEAAGFEERALEERVEDLEWLAATARAHHRVVDAVGHEHLVAPLSLATVYYDDDRVREVFAAGAPVVGHLLDHLAGRSEWGVKAWARPHAAEPTGPEERPRSGAEYLRRRRRALSEGDSSLERAEKAAADLHAALDAVAADSRRHGPQSSTLTGRAERMVLNGAYLVATDDVAALAAVVDTRADAVDLDVEITGPWVPYSFSQVGAP